MTDRRTYAREYARRQRAARLAEEQRDAATCRYRSGPGICGGPLSWKRVPGGEWFRHCPRCERRLAGICQDCPRSVEGRVRSALRCRDCKRHQRTIYTRRYVEQHRVMVRRKARIYGRKHREERIAYKRLWRKANPDKIRAQKRRAALRRNPHVYEYHRGYRMTAAIEGWPYRRRQSKRHCITCPAPVCGRTKKCGQCKDRDRQDAVAILAGRCAA